MYRNMFCLCVHENRISALFLTLLLILFLLHCIAKHFAFLRSSFNAWSRVQRSHDISIVCDSAGSSAGNMKNRIANHAHCSRRGSRRWAKCSQFSLRKPPLQLQAFAFSHSYTCFNPHFQWSVILHAKWSACVFFWRCLSLTHGSARGPVLYFAVHHSSVSISSSISCSHSKVL